MGTSRGNSTGRRTLNVGLFLAKQNFLALDARSSEQETCFIVNQLN